MIDKPKLILWHGSPHIVDKFLLKAVGSGEGQQAQGWGLYFSSREDIALWYAQRLSLLQYEYSASDKQRNEIETAFPVCKSLVAAFDIVNNQIAGYDLEDIKARLDDFIHNRCIALGYVYMVFVEDSHFILWDGYVNEEQAKIIRKKVNIPDRCGGEVAYRMLEEVLGSAMKASKWLYSNGIIGVKYMTGESRRYLEGTYFDEANAEWNYVIFSENEIEMVGIRKVMDI